MTRRPAAAGDPPAATAPARADTRFHLPVRASTAALRCRARRGRGPRAWTLAAASHPCVALRRERGTAIRRRRKGRQPRQEYRSKAAPASGAGRGGV